MHPAKAYYKLILKLQVYLDFILHSLVSDLSYDEIIEQLVVSVLIQIFWSWQTITFYKGVNIDVNHDGSDEPCGHLVLLSLICFGSPDNWSVGIAMHVPTWQHCHPSAFKSLPLV